MWCMGRFVTHGTQCHACEDNVVSSMSRMSHTPHIVTHMKNYSEAYQPYCYILPPVPNVRAQNLNGFGP